MKRIRRRSAVALALVLALLAGLGVYIRRFFLRGGEWIDFWSSQEVYRTGMLASGTVKDRNGLILSEIRDGVRVYGETGDLRTACLHVLGDREGNIGTGALSRFAGYLSGYETLPGMPAGERILTLSVDAALNRTAMEALGARKGAVLVSNYRTGEILCMYSSPSYDPDYGFDPRDDWYEGVYLNRCLSATYPPGSVFKLVTAAAAIENLESLDTRFIKVSGSIMRCSDIHRTQTFEQALANSCNCAFGVMSLELGGETLAEYARRYGLSSPVSVSGIPLTTGKVEAAPAESAALAWSGVGQSTDMICPAAMLRYVGAIANGGDAMELTLLTGQWSQRTQLLRYSTAGKLKRMMRYNVEATYGTENYPGLKLCAKSGTAELGNGESHAWFVGFLDDSAHPYAFTVIIEEGGGGQRNAGPVANTVLQAAVARYS